MGVTLSLRLHKGICHVSHPEQVVTASLAVFRMQHEDFICAQNRCVLHRSSCDNASRYSAYFVCVDSSSPETSRFKLLAFMSARRNCAGTLVEVNLGFQSKIPSKQPNFTPTCDSCDCAFPVVGLLLVSVYLWQLEPSLSLSLAILACLYVSLSVFACHFLSLHLPSFSFSVDGKLTSGPHLLPLSDPPLTTLSGTVCALCSYLQKRLSGVLLFWRFQVLIFNEV